MNTHVMTVSICLSSLLLLSACSSHFTYRDEPSNYHSVPTQMAMPYLSLALPASSSERVGLQVALVKHKRQGANHERWLLLHDIPYQWLWVTWQGEEWYLLAVGPYAIGRQLAQQRGVLQQGLGKALPMPAVALNLSVPKALKGEVIAKREQESEQENSSIP